MSEEQDIDLLESQEHDLPEQEAAQEVDPLEQEARSQGWCPKEEWKGDPDQWKPAQQFVEDGKNPYFKEVHALKKQNKSLMHAQKLLYSKIDEIAKKEYEKAKAELEKARDQAVVQGELEQYHKYNQEIANLKAPEIAPPSFDLDPVEEFLQDFPEVRSPQTTEERRFALKIKHLSEDFMVDNPNASAEDEVAFLRAEIVKMKAHTQRHAANPQIAPTPPRTESARSKEELNLDALRKRAKKAGGNTLDLAKEVAARGYMTEKEYLESCAQNGII